MPPRVSIIILNWNGLNDTIECLESLKKITYQNYEVIVVDNASKGNDADILEERYKDYIRLIKNKENLGFAGGNNAAMKKVIEEGKSDYILLLNNDTVVEPDFLTKLVEVGEKNKKAGAVGPDIRLYSDKNKVQIQKYENFHKISEVDTLSGACLLIKVEVLKKIGLFDEIYFCYGEDRDLCERIKKAGYLNIYVPEEAKIYHKLESSTKDFPEKKVYYMVRNDFLIIKRYKKGKEAFKFFLKDSQIFGFIKLIIRKGKVKLIPPVAKGIIDGIALAIKDKGYKM